MKKLFALMALACLAAFQVGCGEEKKPPANQPAMTPATPGGMPAMQGPAADAKKGEDGKKEDGAATEGDKAAEGDAKDKEEEPKKEE